MPYFRATGDYKVQIRYNDGYIEFETIKKAYKIGKQSNVDKISWRDDGTKYRFVYKRKSEKWLPKSEKRLRFLSRKYRDADPNIYFWVNQSLMPKNLPSYEVVKLKKKKITYEQYLDKYWYPLSIEAVYTDQEFENLFCKN